MEPEIIELNPVSLAEVKKDLKKIKKRDGELTFRGNKTEEHINSLHVISEKDSKDIYDKIDKLKILRMKPKHVIKFVDIMPSSEAEVKYLVGSLSLTVSKENITKINKIISAHIPAKKK
jgi:DNA-directed RNA polymerase subunit F